MFASKIKTHKQKIAIAVLMLMFFVIYSFLPISQLKFQQENNITNQSLKFNTPDETINYYFSTSFAKSNSLYYLEPLNDFMHRVIFPRWAFVIDGKITPGNFLGIDLIYGTLGKIFSINIIAFLTPLFSILGALFFYLIIKKFFNSQVAFISFLLILFFPAWVYYSSRTMFHNILFFSLFLVGLYFLLKLFQTPDSRFKIINLSRTAMRDSTLTGLFFGLSLITRTSEVVWIFLIVLIILIFNFKKLKTLWPYLILSLIIFSACFIPVFYQNKILYNNYFFTGYNLDTMTENLESGEVKKLNLAKAIFLPFGFHPRVIFSVIKNYVVKLFWPWLILWFAGLILFIKDKNKNQFKNYKLYLCLLTTTYYLLFYYGSWFFTDSLNPNLISIGSSYVRYFIPLFIFNIPLIAFLFYKLWSKKIFYKISLLVVACLLLIFSYNLTYSGSESLSSIKNQINKYNIQSQNILTKINSEDIILMDTSTDKIIFPEHKKLIVPQNGVEWPEIKNILNHKKVFYFHHRSDVSQDFLNSNKFFPQDLKISNPQEINGGGVLYKIIKN